jgi:hypothetical protein
MTDLGLSVSRPRTFDAWLRDQVRREDAIGDLARDYKQDCRDHHAEHLGERAWFGESPLALRERLEELGACNDAFTALERAAAEWAQQEWAQPR